MQRPASLCQRTCVSGTCLPGRIASRAGWVAAAAPLPLAPLLPTRPPQPPPPTTWPQCGRADGYILEGRELEFYVKKMAKKKGKSAA